MRVDLHVHAAEWSACAVTPAEQMLRAAQDAGLDGVALTNHGRLVPPARRAELAAQFAPLAIWPGIELTLGGEDLLVLGLEEPKLEALDWTYPDLHAFVRERGGFLVLAHPFRFRAQVAPFIFERPPDAIELHSANIGADDEPAIRELHRALGGVLLCNSDAHSAEEVGVYHSLLPRRPADLEDLFALLRAGAAQPGMLPERVARLNARVAAREAEIREFIKRGDDRLAYRRATGQWEGYFDRVAQGKSYRI